MIIQVFFYTPPEHLRRPTRKTTPKELEENLFFYPVGTQGSTRNPIGNCKNAIEPHLSSLDKPLILYVEVSAKKYFEDESWWSSLTVKFNPPGETIRPELSDGLRKVLREIIENESDPILSSLGSKEPVLDSCLTFSIRTEFENKELQKCLNEIIITYPSVIDGVFVLYAKNQIFYHSDIAEDRHIYLGLKNWIHANHLCAVQKLDTVDCQHVDYIFQQRVVSIYYIKKEQHDVVIGFFCKNPSSVGAAFRTNTKEVINQIFLVL